MTAKRFTGGKDEIALPMLFEGERMLLIGADRDAFLDAVINSPKPAEELVMALRRHRSLFG
ncbi:MAG: hypothetical protein ACXW3P_01125 [Rhodospirillales bacterium]